MVCGQARNALFDRIRVLDRRPAAGYPEEKGPVFRKTAAETVETVPETAETPAETGEPAPKQPRESFFRRQRRELSDAWREIYCNSRARRIRTWQIAVFALLIVEVTVMAVALNPVYWIGTGLLVFWCVGQLFDRRPARHSVAAVVMYFLIAVMIGIFAVQELLGA